MKKNISWFLYSIVLSSQFSYAGAIHCEATYQGKHFRQATIWSNGSGFGRAECDYMEPGDSDVISYKFPKDEDYYTVSGYWRSTMPGTQWCTINDGNTFSTCRFAKRETRR